MADNTVYFLDSAALGKTAQLWRDSQRDNAASAPRTIPRSHNERQMFWGKIVTGGPHGEADYTDGRYWVQLSYLSNTDGTATSAPTFAAGTGNWAITVTAQNLLEMSPSSHRLQAGQVVPVMWDWDSGSPATGRYLICAAVAAGLVPVTCTQDGGTDGSYNGDTTSGRDGFIFPSYTYTCSDLVTGKQLGQSLSPLSRVFEGSCYAASYGTGYFDNSSNFKLLNCDERQKLDWCDNYDGSTNTLGTMGTSLAWGEQHRTSPSTLDPKTTGATSTLTSLGYQDYSQYKVAGTVW